MPKASPFCTGNRLLDRLSPGDLERLLPHFEPVQLHRGEILYNSGDMMAYAYLPTCGMFSLLSTTQSGATVAIAMAGNEGMVGIPIILKVNRTPYQIVVQIRADALRIRADALQAEFNRCGQFQDLVLRYTHSLLFQASQSALCNRFHTVEQRLCRWLLVSQDRVKTSRLELTQETLSQMVGAPRTRVTMAAGVLQEAGLIDSRRGRIRILNRHEMEKACCECYRLVRDGIDRTTSIE